MNCHQILSGACNAGDRCYAVGSVEGISFTVSVSRSSLATRAPLFSYNQIHTFFRLCNSRLAMSLSFII